MYETVCVFITEKLKRQSRKKRQRKKKEVMYCHGERGHSLFLSLPPASLSLPMWVRHAVGIALLERLSKQ